jgi:hypothetical protein
MTNKWHAPGMGEVHYHDHSLMFECMRDSDDPLHDYIADDDLAKIVCDALNSVERMKKALQWIVDNPYAHANNVRTVAKEGIRE